MGLGTAASALGWAQWALGQRGGESRRGEWSSGSGSQLSSGDCGTVASERLRRRGKEFLPQESVIGDPLRPSQASPLGSWQGCWGDTSQGDPSPGEIRGLAC